ncbi:MAG: hypothetical protein AB7F96_00290 [Beijerinckiaceae bacterium]
MVGIASRRSSPKPKRATSSRLPSEYGQTAGSLSEERRYTRDNSQTIAYIAELTEELARLARSIDQDSLAYFLSMARAEAELAALEQHRRSDGRYPES